MCKYNIDFVMSRKTESGDDYLERFQVNNYIELKNEILEEAWDFDYTTEWKLEIIRGEYKDIENFIRGLWNEVNELDEHMELL